MKEISELTEKVKEQSSGGYEALPDIELYMDQVLTFLARRSLSFRDGERMTSAMVNNYIKQGLLPRARGKRYSREHLVYLSLISRLKQVLSVKDTGILLGVDMDGRPLDAYYESFLELLDQSFERLAGDIEQAGNQEDLSALALKLAVSSYADKIVCERLIDLLASGEGQKVREK